MDFLKSEKLSDDKIAELLKISPKAYAEFKRLYNERALDEGSTSGSLFDISKKQADKLIQDELPEAGAEEMEGRIVDELLAVCNGPFLEDKTVTKEELMEIPESQRPQLTGTLYKVDIKNATYQALLWQYNTYLHGKNEKEKRMAYHQFRQGLDMLDLDPISYEILSMNKNSMGFWFPALKEAASAQGFFKIPGTKIIKVPLPILQLTRLGYEQINQASRRIVNDFCMKAFGLDENSTYFVKTGVFSSKFDFRNAKVTGKKEVRELGEYLLYITSQTVAMAGPLASPCIYGAATTNEWVVREFIEDYENNPTIYKGLPLRTEYRIFADLDNDEIIGISPYWRPDVMLKRFGSDRDPNSPHDQHDYIVYKMHEGVLMKRYEESVEQVAEHMQQIIPDINLSGLWSIDVMQSMNKDGEYEYYIIDMATAATSALNDCVPNGIIKKTDTEEWIPALETLT